MTDWIHVFNLTLGVLAIILQVISVAVLILLVFSPKENKLILFLKKHFLFFAFLLSLFSVLLSIFYSEFLHYAPCFLCWLQRIFMFPQVFLLGMAYFRNDKNIFDFSFPLLLVGFFIAAYHEYIYIAGEGSAPCGSSGVSCIQQLVSEIGGYISIPMLSLTSFAALLVILLVGRYGGKEENKLPCIIPKDLSNNP